MKKNAAFIILAAGVIVAIVVGLGTFSWLQKRTTIQSQAVQVEPVIVAATDMTWGTVITEFQVKPVSFLKGSLPAGSFGKASDVVGRTLVYPVKQGEPIFESRLAPASMKGGGVSAVVSDKKRAIAVKVDKVIGVSGFINPGNRVDVLVTVDEQKSKRQSPVTKTVLENVLVLAIGSETEKAGKQEKATAVDVITIEVTPQEAERLALSATEGKVQLALRNPTDTAEVATTGATVPALLASYSAAPPRTERRARKAPAAVAPVKVVETPKPVVTVQGIRGTTVNDYKF